MATHLPVSKSESANLRQGSLLAFSGWNTTSDIINIGTLGIPRISVSHVGIIGGYKNENVLFESTTLTDLPCIIQGKSVKGTQAHRVADRLATYRGGIWYYELYRELYPHEAKRLSEFLISKIPTPYDRIGAIRSLGLGMYESIIFGQDLSALFCSEWCAASLAEIGVLQTSDDSKWNPNHLIRYLRMHGILKAPRRFV